MKGWRTALVATLLFLAGLADVVGAVDMREVLSLLGVPTEKLGGVVALISLGFGVLRYITTSPVGRRCR